MAGVPNMLTSVFDAVTVVAVASAVGLTKTSPAALVVAVAAVAVKFCPSV